jgi:hypothetical protein
MKPLIPLLALGLLLAFVPMGFSEQTPASAAEGRCGVTLVLRNPDLQADSSGIIRASGWFFIQFQASGAGAQNVKTFSFSFGKPAPNDYSNCTTPEWITGAYIKNYRGDYDPEDGFFVPINTTLVPDDIYGAAVHAYDSAGKEVGRYWVTAIVDNCDGGQGSRCGDKPAEVRKHDKVAPWPIVLPGDGKQTNSVNGLTIEFAEALSSIEAWINGVPVNLTSFPGRLWDDDVTPGNDGAQGPTAASCTVSTPLCVKRSWGPAYKYETPIQQNDILKVRAVDLAGNVAVKIIHLLDPNAGGIIPDDVIDVDLQVAEARLSTNPGTAVDFKFTLTNLGGAEAHVNLFVEGPQVAIAEWKPGHVAVPGGERRDAVLTVRPDASIRDADLYLKARAEYQSGPQVAKKEVPIQLTVGKGGDLNDPNATANTTDAGAPKAGADTPAPGVAVSLGVLLAMAVAVRRRRR